MNIAPSRTVVSTMLCLLLCAAFDATAQSSPTKSSLPVCTAAMKRLDTPWAGGSGGESWDDRRFFGAGPISQIEVWSGDYVKAIRVRYGQQYASRHGGNDGKVDTLSVASGERITFVSGRAGRYIDQICFATNRRAEPKCFGNDNGGNSFQVATAGGVVVGFEGRGHDVLDAIHPIFERQWDVLDGSFVTDNLIGSIPTDLRQETDPQTYVNNTDRVQRYTFSKTVSETNTHHEEWRDGSSNAWSLGLELSYSSRTGMSEGAGTSTSATLSFNYTRTETKEHALSDDKSTQVSKAWTQEVVVKPHTAIKATASWYNVPVKGTVKYTAIYYGVNESGQRTDICQEAQSLQLDEVISTKAVVVTEPSPMPQANI